MFLTKLMVPAEPEGSQSKREKTRGWTSYPCVFSPRVLFLDDSGQTVDCDETAVFHLERHP